MHQSRRTFLASLTTLTAASATGCLENLPATGPNEDEVTELENKVDELESREDSLEQQLEEEREKLEEEETTVAELQERLDDAKEETESVQEKLDEADSETSELREEVDELEKEVTILEELLGDQHDFSEEVVEKAYEVGVEAREAVFEVHGGTGFHVGDGKVVTNAHVIAGTPENGYINHYSGRSQSHSGYDLTQEDGSYVDPDVGVVYSDSDDYHALEFGDPDAVAEDQPLITVGHPANTGKYIISLGRHDSFENMYNYNEEPNAEHVSSIPTNSGSSGSPVMTLDGKVVAVITGTVSGRGETAPDRVFKTLRYHNESTRGTSAAVVQSHLDEWN